MSVTIPIPGTKKARVGVQVSHISSGHFGCHAVGLTQVSVSLTSVHDPEKEILRGEWGALSSEKAQECLDLVRQEGEHRDLVFGTFAKIFKTNCLVFMTAPCNTDDDKPDRTHHNHGKLGTAGFADWLRRKGEFIMGSPLLSNPQHQISSFSLLRGWMWVPTLTWPSQEQVRHIAGTEYISGTMQSGLPFPEWWEHYQKYHSEHRLKTDRRAIKPGETPGEVPHSGFLVPFTPDQLIG